MTASLDLKQYIRNIPDFPKPGILFRDITPLLAAPAAFREVVRRMAEHYRTARIDVVVAAEARGFIFAAPLALELNAGFVPIRKPGKLPFERQRLQYDLEYGSDALEMHADAVGKGHRVLLVDDLLATGGTMETCLRLVANCGAVPVGCAFVIELDELNGRKRLRDQDVLALVHYDTARDSVFGASTKTGSGGYAEPLSSRIAPTLENVDTR